MLRGGVHGAAVGSRLLGQAFVILAAPASVERDVANEVIELSQGEKKEENSRELLDSIPLPLLPLLPG